MKSTITNQSKKAPAPFPKLMIDVDGDVFYMLYANPDTGKGHDTATGVLIHAVSANSRSGIYDDGWNMSLFRDFEGEITISND